MYRVYRSARGAPGGLRAKRMAQVSGERSLSVSGESELQGAAVFGHPRLWESDDAGAPVLPIADVQRQAGAFLEPVSAGSTSPKQVV